LLEKYKVEKILIQKIVQIIIALHFFIFFGLLVEEYVDYRVNLTLTNHIEPMKSKLHSLELSIDPLKQKIFTLEEKLKDLTLKKLEQIKTVAKEIPLTKEVPIMKEEPSYVKKTISKIELFEQYLTWKNLLGVCTSIVSVYSAFALVRGTIVSGMSSLREAFATVDNSNLTEIAKTLVVKKPTGSEEGSASGGGEDSLITKSTSDITLGDLGIRPNIKYKLRNNYAAQEEVFDTTNDSDVDDMFE
jgi:hypothetical protein